MGVSNLKPAHVALKLKSILIMFYSTLCAPTESTTPTETFPSLSKYVKTVMCTLFLLQQKFARHHLKRHGEKPKMQKQ